MAPVAGGGQKDAEKTKGEGPRPLAPSQQKMKWRRRRRRIGGKEGSKRKKKKLGQRKKGLFRALQKGKEGTGSAQRFCIATAIYSCSCVWWFRLASAEYGRTLPQGEFKRGEGGKGKSIASLN